ncbi:aspartate aminotransferase family protein [Paenibacillus qinlingensis]|uniref:Glutamate-1-semialdehyde 2,1-aminomutase n=1 Tax=Paenibacillus qinlingensis TaxID=1837343 RepID=A0ABU1P0F3_9BACL|nr:aspartate aminotransferase family protein [Paenibacillus qinlingensis]MDR6553193.1 glutamate-1-semialdehyde 2,1-aminomutase [Paenibacillus qinlingensis]
MRTYEQSIAKHQAAKQHLAGGVASSLRASMKPTPLYAKSAKAACITDVDGNTYIDYLLAYGPLILGHAHDGLNESIHQALLNGATYGLQHDGEIKLADLLTEVLPCAEKVSLSGSGTEAVMLALRLSRAYTNKTKVVRFHGHYHGWSDSIFTSFPSSDMSQKASDDRAAAIPPGTFGQSENSLDDIILLPWNDPEALESTLRTRGHEIAAVITEPVMCNSGCIQPKAGYLALMRKLTQELNIVMIMDEVITGFRLSLGGAHGRFDIRPDLVVIGKAMGGGIAISAVAGNAEIMKLVDEGKVSHLGTLNGNCVSTAAAIATISHLAQDNGAAYKHMETLFTELADGIRALLSKHSIPGVVNQIGPVMHMMFIDAIEVNDFETFNKRDAAQYTRFAELMLEEGVLLRPNGLWYISTAHQSAEIEATLRAMDRVFVQLTLQTSEKQEVTG